ncbi:EamA family transporter [Chitinibacteraceae bacterium HSL-7]
MWRITLATAVAPVFWGTTYLVTTEFLPPDRPLLAALIRTLPAGLVMVLASRKLAMRWWQILILALLNITVFQALLFVAAYRLPGGLAAVVGAVQPLLMVGMLWLLQGERPRALTLAACAGAMVGMTMLMLGPNARFDHLGVIAALIGTSAMAVGTLLAKRWRGETSVLALAGWQLLLGGLMLLPLALLLEPAVPSLTLTNLAGYAYLSIFGTLLAYALWFRGVSALSPVGLSALALLSPLTAAVLGWLVLGQVLHGVALTGFALVLASVLIAQLPAEWLKSFRLKGAQA